MLYVEHVDRLYYKMSLARNTCTILDDKSADISHNLF